MASDSLPTDHKWLPRVDLDAYRRFLRDQGAAYERLQLLQEACEQQCKLSKSMEAQADARVAKCTAELDRQEAQANARVAECLAELDIQEARTQQLKQ